MNIPSLLHVVPLPHSVSVFPADPSLPHRLPRLHAERRTAVDRWHPYVGGLEGVGEEVGKAGGESAGQLAAQGGQKGGREGARGAGTRGMGTGGA